MTTSTTLADGLEVYCLRRPETLALDGQIEGYFRHGISVKKGDVVLDVGANIGLFALRALKRAQGEARIFSFEPVPPIFSVLKQNAARVHPYVEAVNEALGMTGGNLSVTYFPRSPSLSSAHSHLWDSSPGGLAQAVKRAMETPPPGYEKIGRLLPAWSKSLIANFIVGKKAVFECPMSTISSFIARRELAHIDVLKVDVEGAEHEVLKGIQDEDWHRIRSLVVEVHDVDGRLETLRTLLSARGLSQQAVEVEPGFSGTHLVNLYATRLVS